MIKQLSLILLCASLAWSQGSYSEQVKITTANSMAVDAFGRLRASFPVTLFDAQNQYNASPLFWQDSIGANADTNFLFNGSAVQLATTAGGAGNVIRQTRSYFRYQSGKSQFILLTGVPHIGKANSIKRWGYFDAFDGIFFELNGTTLNIVKRSSASGSVVDSTIAQSNFNMDKLNGTGASGFNLKIYNAAVYWVEIAWLGVSRVRAGVVNERGEFVVAHEFQNGNNNTGVYMRTANLPVRYQLTTSAGVADTLTAICSSVQSEAGDDNESGIGFSASNGISSIGVTTRRAILSIAPKLTFNGKPNRMKFQNFDVELYATTNAAFYEIVYDGTLGGTPSWTDVDVNSGMQYDVAGTTVTGGDVVATGFIPASATARAVAVKELLRKLALTIDIAGTRRKTLSVVVTSFTGTSNVSASLSWEEIY